MTTLTCSGQNFSLTSVGAVGLGHRRPGGVERVVDLGGCCCWYTRDRSGFWHTEKGRSTASPASFSSRPLHMAADEQRWQGSALGEWPSGPQKWRQIMKI